MLLLAPHLTIVRVAYSTARVYMEALSVPEGVGLGHMLELSMSIRLRGLLFLLWCVTTPVSVVFRGIVFLTVARDFLCWLPWKVLHR